MLQRGTNGLRNAAGAGGAVSVRVPSVVEILQRLATEDGTKLNPAVAVYNDARHTPIADQWSFSKLYTKSCQVAGYLQSTGLKPGDRLAVLSADRSVYDVAIFYACLMSGVIYVPLDATDDLSRIQDLLRRASCCAAIVDRSWSSWLSSAMPAVQCFEIQQLETLSAEHTFAPRLGDEGSATVVPNGMEEPVSLPANDIAYLVTSSGSTTGASTITPIGAAGLAAWVFYFQNSTDSPCEKLQLLGRDLSYWLDTPRQADPWIYGVIMALSQGGRVVLGLTPAAAQAFAAGAFNAATWGPSHTESITRDPTFMAGLADREEKGCSAVVVTTTGSALRRSHVAHLLERSGICIANGFGASQTVIGNHSLMEVGPGSFVSDAADAPAFIQLDGHAGMTKALCTPLSDAEGDGGSCLVLDDLQSAPAGKYELLVSAPYLVPGYWLGDSLSEAGSEDWPEVSVKSGDGRAVRCFALGNVVGLGPEGTQYHGRTTDDAPLKMCGGTKKIPPAPIVNAVKGHEAVVGAALGKVIVEGAEIDCLRMVVQVAPSFNVDEPSACGALAHDLMGRIRETGVQALAVPVFWKFVHEFPRSGVKLVPLRAPLGKCYGENYGKPPETPLQNFVYGKVLPLLNWPDSLREAGIFPTLEMLSSRSLQVLHRELSNKFPGLVPTETVIYGHKLTSVAALSHHIEQQVQQTARDVSPPLTALEHDINVLFYEALPAELRELSRDNALAKFRCVGGAELAWVAMKARLKERFAFAAAELDAMDDGSVRALAAAVTKAWANRLNPTSTNRCFTTFSDGGAETPKATVNIVLPDITGTVDAVAAVRGVRGPHVYGLNLGHSEARVQSADGQTYPLWCADFFEQVQVYASLIFNKFGAAKQFNISGWSAGGAFARAVAQELMRRGAEVRQVVIVDAEHPSLHHIAEGERLAYHAGKLWRLVQLLPPEYGLTATDAEWNALREKAFLEQMTACSSMSEQVALLSRMTKAGHAASAGAGDGGSRSAVAEAVCARLQSLASCPPLGSGLWEAPPVPEPRVKVYLTEDAGELGGVLRAVPLNSDNTAVGVQMRKTAGWSVIPHEDGVTELALPATTHISVLSDAAVIEAIVEEGKPVGGSTPPRSPTRDELLIGAATPVPRLDASLQEAIAAQVKAQLEAQLAALGSHHLPSNATSAPSSPVLRSMPVGGREQPRKISDPGTVTEADSVSVPSSRSSAGSGAPVSAQALHIEPGSPCASGATDTAVKNAATQVSPNPHKLSAGSFYPTG